MGEVQGWREEIERDRKILNVGSCESHILSPCAKSWAGEGDKGILLSFKSGGPSVKEMTATFGFFIVFVFCSGRCLFP